MSARGSVIALQGDRGPLKEEITKAEQEAERASRSITQTIRRTAQNAMLVLQISGVVIDQVFRLYLESLLVGIEVVSAIAGGTLGISTVFQVGQIIAMLILIRRIKQGRADAARQTEGAVQLLRMMTY